MPALSSSSSSAGGSGAGAAFGGAGSVESAIFNSSGAMMAEEQHAATAAAAAAGAEAASSLFERIIKVVLGPSPIDWCEPTPHYGTDAIFFCILPTARNFFHLFVPSTHL